MKKIIILIAIMINISYSQELLNPKKLAGVDFTSSNFNRNFMTTNFTYGWNWSSPGLKLDNALHINAHHNQFWTNGWDNKPSFDNTKYSSNYGFYVNITGLCGRKDPNPFVGFGQYFEPALEVDTTNNFVANSEAELGAAFGFMYKNMSIGSNTFFIENSNTFGCFRLNKNTISNSSATILKDIWKKNILTNFSKNTTSGSDAILFTTHGGSNSFYNGTVQHLSINLRAIENFDNEVDDDTEILKIRLPYRKTSSVTVDNITSTTISNSYINFSQLPKRTNNITNDTIQIYGSNTFGSVVDYRGLARKLVINANTDPTEFIITKGMMKTAANNNSGTFITLTAEFLCDGLTINNPFFYYGTHGGSNTFIDNIDMEISYSGTINTDINWVKIETPSLEQIYRGKKDYILEGHVKNLVDNFLANSSTNTANAKIARFYFNDELIPCQYEQHRYLNNLVDKLIISETFIMTNNKYESFKTNSIPHFFNATLQDAFWSGSTLNYLSIDANPFVRRTDSAGISRRTQTMMYDYGYLGRYPDDHGSTSTSIMTNEPGNSLYETYFNHSWSLTPLPVSNVSSTFESANYENFTSALQKRDYFLYWGMYKVPNLYYSEKPYISNIWGISGLTNNTGTFTGGSNTFFSVSNAFYGTRPVSGEEFRGNLGSELLRGSKGMFFWFKTTNRETTTFTYSSSTFHSPNPGFAGVQSSADNSFQSTLPEGINLIYDENIGGDFIKSTNDPNMYHEAFVNSNYDWNTMDVKVGRYYIGLMSERAEMYKHSNLIFGHESEFLNMRLQA